MIPAGEVRISGVMGVQTSLGHILMTESLVEQGLTGRLMFFSAIDPDMPKHEDAPEWPGQLDLKPPLQPL